MGRHRYRRPPRAQRRRHSAAYFARQRERAFFERMAMDMLWLEEVKAEIERSNRKLDQYELELGRL